MEISLRDILALTTISLFLTTLFTWADILKNIP